GGRRAYLGLIGRPRALSRRLARMHGLSRDAGVEVVEVNPDGPAARASVRTGDVIVAINDNAISTVDDLHRALGDWPIGERLELHVLRGTQRYLLELVPAEAS
ncbi:MAG: S1C family serine protease, partial [Acidiferrobacterales bacterium]